MKQFSVHANKNLATKARLPYLLNVQSDLLSDLETCVVIPLQNGKTMKGKALTVLMPVFEIEGKPCVLLTPQLAGVSKKELGVEITNLSAQRSDIVAALDLLVAGV